MRDSEIAGALGIGRGFAVFVGRRAVTPPHSHRAVQLVVSAKSSFELRTVGTLPRFAEIALIPSGSPHGLEADSAVAILLVDSDGPRGRRLDALAGAPLSDAHRRAIRAVAPPTPTAVDVARATREWLEALDVGGPEGGPSEEVSTVLAVVERAALSGESMGLVDVARAVSLSPTRVTHRVSRELGLPYRALVRWTRMRVAMRARYAGKSLTEAALAAGFADASHLSRTFRAALGVAPSWLSERVSFLEVEIDRAVQAPPKRIP